MSKKFYALVLLIFMLQVNFISPAFGKDDIKEKPKKQKKRKKKSGGSIESAMIFEAPKTAQVVDSVVIVSEENVKEQVTESTEPVLNLMPEFSQDAIEKTEVVVSEEANKPYTLPAEHLAQKNENLYSIARKYNIPVADLILLNNLSSTEIKEGQKIVLTGNLATAKKENSLPAQQAVAAESKAQAVDDNTNNSNNISPQDVFIGCYAVAEEKAAIAKTNFLKEKGYNAGYFYIPDYVLNGKKLYRVYAGPFSDQKTAKLALAEIQKFRETAYIFKVR